MRHFAVLAVSLLVGCDRGTPVTYEVCDEKGADCSAFARFKNFENCERYKRMNDLIAFQDECSAKDGAVVCRKAITLGIATSHCTR